MPCCGYHHHVPALLSILWVVKLDVSRADDETTYTPHAGFLKDGDDVEQTEMSIADAKDHCASLPDCKGFTFEIFETSINALHEHEDEPRTIWFKNRWEFQSYPHWASYQREEPSRLHPRPLATFKSVLKLLPKDHARAARTPLTHIFGISYGPLPRVRSDDVGTLTDEFVMGQWYEGQWGPGGRNDIGVLHRLGANAVLLHGRGPWHAPSRFHKGHVGPQHQHSCVFKWFRFDPIKTRAGYWWGEMEMNEIQFKNADGLVVLKNARVSNDYWAPRGPKNLVDGRDWTSYYTRWMREITFELDNPIEVTAFRFSTGVDNIRLDPVQWRFQASRDGIIWIDLHTQESDYSTPTARKAHTKWFQWDNHACRPRHHSLFNATPFLDNANRFRMKVILGLPDHPFLHSQHSCARTAEMDCYGALRHAYAFKLQLGFSVLMGESQVRDYHPAIDTIVLMNEPERKLQEEGRTGPRANYLRALISAFDGILASEQKVGIDPLSSMVRFTVTFSYAPCPTCKSFMLLASHYKLGCCVECGGDIPCSEFGEAGEKLRCPKNTKADSSRLCPVLAQVLDLHEAMKNPASVGYPTPKLEHVTLFEVYQARWVHSFNANVPFKTVKEQVLDKYEKLNIARSETEKIPIFIAEYKSAYPSEKLKFASDLAAAKLEAHRPASSFSGFNIHQFQIDYATHCDEAQWRMYKQGSLTTNPCPERAFGLFALGSLDTGESAYVPVLRQSMHFRPIPIHCLYIAQQWKLKAVARLFGGSFADTSVCEAGADKHPNYHCVASRKANASLLHRQTLYACEKLRGRYDCEETPANCNQPFEKADWIFSISYNHYHELHPRFAKSFCKFSGVGKLTPFPPRPDCTADPNTVRASTMQHAPSPSEMTQATGGSLVVLTCLCLSLACTAGSCFIFMRKPNLRIFAGIQPPTSISLTGNVQETAAQPYDRSGTLELADWR